MHRLRVVRRGRIESEGSWGPLYALARHQRLSQVAWLVQPTGRFALECFAKTCKTIKPPHTSQESYYLINENKGAARDSFTSAWLGSIALRRSALIFIEATPACAHGDGRTGPWTKTREVFVLRTKYHRLRLFPTCNHPAGVFTYRRLTDQEKCQCACAGRGVVSWHSVTPRSLSEVRHISDVHRIII